MPGTPLRPALAAVILLVLTAPAFAYRTVRSEAEAWQGGGAYEDATCSGRHAAILEGTTSATVHLPTSEVYHVWARTHCPGTVAMTLSVAGLTASAPPGDVMCWWRVGKVTGETDVPARLDAPNGPARADVILFTTNPNWQPRPSTQAVVQEVEQAADLSVERHPRYSSGTGVWADRTVSLDLTLPSRGDYSVWLRAWDNGRRDIGVSVDGGEMLVSDYLEPVRWWKVGEVHDVTKAAVEISRQGPEYLGIADAIVATDDPAWDPQPHQLDLLGQTPIPPDVPPDVTPPTFGGLRRATREGDEAILEWDAARHEGPPNPPFVAFFYAEPEEFLRLAPYLASIGWNGINTIPAQWYDSEEALAARTPAWRETISQCKALGMDAFYVKKALSYDNWNYHGSTPFNPERGRFLPDWFDDADWARQVANFAATARFAREIGARGIALDQELYLTSAPDDMAHMWLESRWTAKGHTVEQICRQVYKRASQAAQAVLAEFPAAQIMLFPAYYDMRQPMTIQWYAGFIDAHPGGGVLLATERLYLPKGDATLDGWRAQVGSVEEATLEPLKDVIERNRDYWDSHVRFAHGAWPLNSEGANYDPEVFGNQLAAFGERSALVWMYTDLGTWLSPEEQRVRQPEGRVFDNSEFATVLRAFSRDSVYHVYAGPSRAQLDTETAIATVVNATKARVPVEPDARYFLVRASDRSGNEDRNHRALRVAPER